MSIAAAVHWSHRAGRDWIGYVSALEQRQHHESRAVILSR
jgi:hypothetical protein